MATVLETLNKSYQDLLSHNISTAKLDSEVILASVLKTNRINLITKKKFKSKYQTAKSIHFINY